MKINQENTAWLSHAFFTDERLNAFYLKFRDQTSGFPGIHELIGQAGQAINDFEDAYNVEWDGEFDAVIDLMSNWIYEQSDLPTPDTIAKAIVDICTGQDVTFSAICAD